MKAESDHSHTIDSLFAHFSTPYLASRRIHRIRKAEEVMLLWSEGSAQDFVRPLIVRTFSVALHLSTFHFIRAMDSRQKWEHQKFDRTRTNRNFPCVEWGWKSMKERMTSPLKHRLEE
jgi:hypothetical protein